MTEIQRYIEAFGEKIGKSTDYGIGKALNVKPSTVWNYRHGKSVPDNYMATKIAEQLGIDPMEVISAAEKERAERTGDQEKASFWQIRWERVSHQPRIDKAEETVMIWQFPMTDWGENTGTLRAPPLRNAPFDNSTRSPRSVYRVPY